MKHFEYEPINDGWPEPPPKLTKDQAINMVKWLYHQVFEKDWQGSVEATSGRGSAIKVSGKVITVNISLYAPRIIHRLSHAFHQMLFPKETQHAPSHGPLGREMSKLALSYIYGSSAGFTKRRTPGGSPRDVTPPGGSRVLLFDDCG